MSKTNTKYTSQHIDNQSFDEGLQVKVTELINTSGVLINPATEETLQAVLDASGGGGLSSYSFMQDSPSAESGYFYTVKINSSDAWLMVRDPSDGATPRKFANVGNNALVTTWSDAWTDRATLTYDTLDNITL